MDSKEFFYEFGKLLYKIDGFYSDIAKESDVKPNLMWVLYALNDGKSHSQKEISKSWDLPLTTINTIVLELKKEGMVELVSIPKKKRERNLVLTEKGKQYSCEVLANIIRMEAKTYSLLGDRAEHLIDDLHDLLETLKACKEENEKCSKF